MAQSKTKLPTVRVTTKLPWHFGARARGVVAHSNLTINGGKLRARLLVFDKPISMRRFWAKYMGNPLDRRCLGAVNGLAVYAENPVTGRRVRQVDARFFCVIGLCRQHLTMRIISHEAVHVGFCFAKRQARSWWDVCTENFHEEGIAYPSGEVAASIVTFLNRKKLLK